MGNALVYYNPITNKFLLVREMIMGKDAVAVFDGDGDKVGFWLHSRVIEEHVLIGEL